MFVCRRRPDQTKNDKTAVVEEETDRLEGLV